MRCAGLTAVVDVDPQSLTIVTKVSRLRNGV
jgi:hypothetical protein